MHLLFVQQHNRNFLLVSNNNNNNNNNNMHYYMIISHVFSNEFVIRFSKTKRETILCQNGNDV